MNPSLHGTTIVCVRRDGRVAMAADGQVSLGQTIVKSNARKIRRLFQGQVLAGFAGSTADALTLTERFETELDKHGGQLLRAAVELAREWRGDRTLRRLEAMLCVADRERSLIISGNGDVLDPEDGIIALGSGGFYALAAARALCRHTSLDAATVCREALLCAADICVYTNHEILLEELLPSP